MLDARTAANTAGSVIPDPLDPDVGGDIARITTDRRLVRLVTVAADVGARFAIEKSPHDPVAWMMAPRRLFDGARPIDACQERDGFLHATLMHGLGLGLDARREDIAALVDEEDLDGDGANEDATSTDAEADETGEATGLAAGNVVSVDFPRHGRALYCCSLSFEEDRLCVQAFCAVVASDREAARRRIMARFGGQTLKADVREGFDPGAPLACGLVSDATAAMLELVAADPYGPLADGLDISLEQRFAA